MERMLTAEIERSPKGARVAAFFDLDRTLLWGFSGVELTRYLVRRGKLGPGDLARSGLAAAALGAGRAGFSGLIGAFAGALAGMPESELEALGEEVFAKRTAARVFPESRAIVRAHLRRGHTVAFVSSAMRYQIEPLARDLGVEHVLCTKLEVRDGLLTGDVTRPACYGPGKAEAMRRFARARKIDLAKSWYYGDSRSDVPALEAVGNPRPTNPDSRLAAIARRRGWPVRHFSSRGVPSLIDVARSAAALGSFVPAAASSLPALAFRGGLRAAVNETLATWGDLGTAIAGITLNVEGEKNLWKQRPAVFVFNHQSAIEVLLVCKLLRKDFVGIAKEELKRYPVIGRAFEAFGTVFVDRSDRTKAIEAMRPVVDAIRKGSSVVIAPEGTRSPTPALGAFKKGAFHIAMQAGVPVVPIVFRNTSDALPKRGLVIRPATIDVVVLPPVSTKKWKEKTIDKHIASIRTRFEATLNSSTSSASKSRTAGT